MQSLREIRGKKEWKRVQIKRSENKKIIVNDKRVGIFQVKYRLYLE